MKSTINTNPTNPGNQNCVDKYTRCSEFTQYCDHPTFVNQMNVYCALSCGQCQGSENPTQGNRWMEQKVSPFLQQYYFLFFSPLKVKKRENNLKKG